PNSVAPTVCVAHSPSAGPLVATESAPSWYRGASGIYSRSDVGGRHGGAGFWSAGGGTAGTGKVNPGLLPEGGQVACHRASCRYRPQSLADDQGTLDRRVSGVPSRVRGVRLRDESGSGDAR